MKFKVGQRWAAKVGGLIEIISVTDSYKFWGTPQPIRGVVIEGVEDQFSKGSFLNFTPEGWFGDREFGRYEQCNLATLIEDVPLEVSVKKYTPGQLLNSAAEVMQALLDYQEVVDKNGLRWQMERGLVVAKGPQAAMYDTSFLLNNGPFTIYTPPKRTIKSERWFAIRQSTWTHDGVAWDVFNSESEARNRQPKALAYVPVSVEVHPDA